MFETKGTCRCSSITCVYMLVDPRNNVPFYVGIGRLERPKTHFRGPNGNHFRYRLINKLRNAGCADKDMIVYLVKGISSEQARKIEIELIAKYGRSSIGTGPLTNHTAGGERHPLEDPAVRKLHTKSIKNKNADPEFRAKRKAAIQAWHADPANKKRKDELRTISSERMKQIVARPEVKKNTAERNRKMNADPVFKKAAIERMTKLNEQTPIETKVLWHKAASDRMKKMNAKRYLHLIGEI